MKTKRSIILGILVLGAAFLLQNCSQEPDAKNTEQLHLLANPDQDENGCKCPESTSFMIPDSICVNGSFLDSMNAQTDKSPITALPPTTTHAPDWTYCSSGSSKSISSGLSTPMVLQSGNSISCTVGDITTDPSSTKQPTVIVYNKPSIDTLFFIISYNENTKYASENITFDYEIGGDYKFLKTFLLQDDPKTSRGTVTTVQSHIVPKKKFQ